MKITKENKSELMDYMESLTDCFTISSYYLINVYKLENEIIEKFETIENFQEIHDSLKEEYINNLYK